MFSNEMTSIFLATCLAILLRYLGSRGFIMKRFSFVYIYNSVVTVWASRTVKITIQEYQNDKYFLMSSRHIFSGK